MATPEKPSSSLKREGLNPAELKALQEKLTTEFTERGLFTNVYSDEPNDVSEPHAHAGATLVTLEGSASIRLDEGEWHTAVPGDITVIHEDQLHEVRAGETGWRYLFACSQEEAQRQGL
ncbi:MAG: AraC family ligand binding domain-containing protein [Patescibacteria group bacterium]|mgnify:FL=1